MPTSRPAPAGTRAAAASPAAVAAPPGRAPSTPDSAPAPKATAGISSCAPPGRDTCGAPGPASRSTRPGRPRCAPRSRTAGSRAGARAGPAGSSAGARRSAGGSPADGSAGPTRSMPQPPAGRSPAAAAGASGWPAARRWRAGDRCRCPARAVSAGRGRDSAWAAGSGCRAAPVPRAGAGRFAGGCCRSASATAASVFVVKHISGQRCSGEAIFLPFFPDGEVRLGAARRCAHAAACSSWVGGSGCQRRSSRSRVSSRPTSLRMTATRATLGGLPRARSRS